MKVQYFEDTDTLYIEFLGSVIFQRPEISKKTQFWIWMLMEMYAQLRLSTRVSVLTLTI